MRLRHPDGQIVHLACAITGSNATDLISLLRVLDRHAVPERRRLSLDTLGVSLHLHPGLAAALAAGLGMRRRLRQELATRGLEMVTMHVASATHITWRAWWTHTLDLARVLVDLLPEDCAHGSISATLPPSTGDPIEWDAAGRLVNDLSGGLTEIAWHTGTLVRVALQSAPQTLITCAEDAARLLGHADPARVGVCLSPAQLAEAGLPPAQELARLRRGRLAVVKLRLDPGEDHSAVGSAVLGGVLGGAHAECDHLEAAPGDGMDIALQELGALGLDGATDRPMPGMSRAA